MDAIFAKVSRCFTAYGRYPVLILALLLLTLCAHFDRFVFDHASTVVATLESPFTGPVEKTAEGLIIKPAKPYSMAQTPIKIRKNTWYLVLIDQDSRQGFSLDFFGFAYDKTGQDRTVQPQQKRATFVIFSGSVPQDHPVFFRIFFNDDYPVTLRNLYIAEAPAWLSYHDLALYAGLVGMALVISMMLRSFSNREAFWLFCIITLIYVFIATVPAGAQLGDNMWYFPTAESLLSSGTVVLDQFRQKIQAVNGYAIVPTPLGSVNFFPPGPSLLALPFLFIGQLLGQDIMAIAEFTAKALAAGTAALLYLLALELGLRRRYALLLTLIFAFGTSHLPIHAGGYWSHNCSSFLASLLLLMALRIFGRRHPKSAPDTIHQHHVLLVAIVIVLGYTCRPDFSLWVVALGFFLVSRSFYGTVLTVIYSSLLLGIFVLWSVGVYGTWLPPYFSATRISEPSLDILLKQLFSPNRGLLIYNPVFLLAVFALYYAWLDWRNRFIFILIFLYVTLSAILISGFGHWWAGFSFGPRIYASLFPALAVLLIPFFLWMQDQPVRWKHRLLGTLVAVGVLINAPGAFSDLPHDWNVKPSSVDDHPERISDWTDLQFMRFYGNLFDADPSGTP